MEALSVLPLLSATKASADFDVQAWKQSCYDAMNDDFNTPILIAELFSAVKYINQIKDGTNTIDAINLELLKTRFTLLCLMF